MADSSVIGIKGFSILDPSTWLPVFGNWGGPGWSGGQRTTEPLSDVLLNIGAIEIPGRDGQDRQSPLDAIFKVHDINYSVANGLPNEASLKFQADLQLMQGIAGLSLSTGDLTNLSNDMYDPSGAPTGWPRLSSFPGDGGFYGAANQNTNGEIFAVMRGMENSLLDAGAIAQVKLGLEPCMSDCGDICHS